MAFQEVLANFLPQFHECEENNKWWGQGFTEWTLVKEAGPLYPGHNQPRVPSEGYYDLGDGIYLGEQYRRARNAGITGFNSYFYWSNGQTLLDKAILSAFENTNLDFRLCFTWANHPWTRTWSNRQGAEEVLFMQNYEEREEGFERFCRHLDRFFSDPRYIRLDGNPIFCIYKPEDLPQGYTQRLRAKFRQIFDYEPYFIGLFNSRATHVSFNDFDAIAPFNPTNALFEKGNQLKRGVSLSATARRYALQLSKYASIFGIRLKFLDRSSISFHGYSEVMDRLTQNFEQTSSRSSKPVFPMVFSGFDNSPRYGPRARIMTDVTPKRLKEAILEVSKSSAQRSWNHSVLFINAWNEWSEGMYLEPDNESGTRYLDAVGEALSETNG